MSQRTNCEYDLQILEHSPKITNPNIKIICAFCQKNFEKTRDLERHLESKKNSCYIKRLENQEKINHEH
jgi:hypothetical protein